MTTLTIELDEAQAETIAQIAARTGLASADVLKLALEYYDEAFAAEETLPPLTDEERASIQRGREQAERGEGKPAEDLLAELRAQYRK
jgi:predicted transcriptional regulator